jgi:hypothetical protein
MKCLAKAPQDRWSSMEELARALRSVPATSVGSFDGGGLGAPVTGARPVAIEHPPVPGRRGAGPAVVVAAALVATVSLTVAFLALREPAPAYTPPPASVAPASPAPPSPTATLHVETDPPGAKVKEEGDTMCEVTPCDIVYIGAPADPAYEHLLTFMKADYKLERKIVKTGASPLSVKLNKAR